MAYKHFPFPWADDAEILPWASGAMPGVRVTFGVTEHVEGPVCIVPSQYGDEEAMATARLIAAVPEMMLALYSVSDASEYMEFDPDSRFGEAVAKVEYAILKAVGVSL
jgi:hypothetical protein